MIDFSRVHLATRLRAWADEDACDTAAACLPPRSNGVQAASISAWPAAGGGLLLGMIVPGWSGRVPSQQRVKNLFLRFGVRGPLTVIIPYVRLEPDALRCAADLVSAELSLCSEQISIDHYVAGTGAIVLRRVVDLGPACEFALVLLAAVGRTLLTMAAAELWGAASADCIPKDGSVTCAALGRSASYRDLAGDAALLPLPPAITLGAGLQVVLPDE